MSAVTAEKTSPRERGQSWLKEFCTRMREHDFDGVMDLFADSPPPSASSSSSSSSSFWRDISSFTWNIATFEGPIAIKEALANSVPGNEPITWTIREGTNVDLPGESCDLTVKDEGYLSLQFDFVNGHTRGRGVLRLWGNNKCHTLMTYAENLTRFPVPLGRPHGLHKDTYGGPADWKQSSSSSSSSSSSPYVFVVGGGQAGVMLGARLARMGVPHVVAERQPRVGDSWRSRYVSRIPVGYFYLLYLLFKLRLVFRTVLLSYFYYYSCRRHATHKHVL